MVDILGQPDATRLDPEERKGLKLSWVTTRGDLNQAEQINIIAGERWAHRQRRHPLISESFVRELHRRMFGDVWAWAGKYRQSQKNIGIDQHGIPVEVRKLVDDANYWIEHRVYPADELALRFHHRAVWIHPFPNGNGRYARLHADLIAEDLGQDAFSWGRSTLTDVEQTRKRYIAALQAADERNFVSLLRFARS